MAYFHKKVSSTSGGFVPDPIKGFAPGPYWGHGPQTLILAIPLHMTFRRLLLLIMP